MDAIKDIIPRVIGPLSGGKTNPMDIAQAWGRLIKEHHGMCIAGFKEGILTVHVDCSARLVKMNLQKMDLLDDLKAKLPYIHDIRFKVGKII